MVKVGPGAHDIVIGTYDEQSELYSREVSGAVHQDGIQAMGGRNIHFVGFYMQKDVGGNSHVFVNMDVESERYRPTSSASSAS